MRSSNADRNEAGQVLVELAVALPIVLLALLAIVSLAGAAGQKTVTTRAAAAAARAAVNGTGFAAIDAIKVYEAESGSSPESLELKVKETGSGPLIFSKHLKVVLIKRSKSVSILGWRPSYRFKEEFVIDQYNDSIWPGP